MKTVSKTDNLSVVVYLFSIKKERNRMFILFFIPELEQ